MPQYTEQQLIDFALQALVKGAIAQLPTHLQAISAGIPAEPSFALIPHALQRS
jgi:hypothetical protein